MEGWLPIFFLMVVLKIPVGFALWLVWWAARSEPRVEDAPPEDGHGFRRWRRLPRDPRGPRRGPHGGGARVPVPVCPPGIRLRGQSLTAAVPVGAGARRASEPR